MPAVNPGNKNPGSRRQRRPAAREAGNSFDVASSEFDESEDFGESAFDISVGEEEQRDGPQGV